MKKIKVFISIIIILFLTMGIVLAADRVERGDKVAIFQDLVIEEDVKVRGDIIAIFSDVKIKGELDGDVVSILGKLEINNIVDGSVISVLGNIDMAENATITRDKIQVTVGDNDLPSTSRIGGEEITIKLFRNEVSSISAILIFLLISFVIMNILGFIFSAILIAIIPERMDKITDQIALNKGRRLGIGILILVIFYAASTVLSAIIIGIPLVLILVILKMLLGLGGNTALKLAIGRRIGKGEWSKTTELIVGSVIYMIIDITIILKPLLYIGKVIGIGAIADTRIGSVDRWDNYSKKKYENTPTYSVVKDEKEKGKDSKVDDTPKLNNVNKVDEDIEKEDEINNEENNKDGKDN